MGRSGPNRGEDEPDQYWIGRATRIEKTYEKEGSVAGTGGRVRYDIGDVEIEVEWFRRDVSGGDERRVFGVWKRVVDADGIRWWTQGQSRARSTRSIRRSCA